MTVDVPYVAYVFPCGYGFDWSLGSLADLAGLRNHNLSWFGWSSLSRQTWLVSATIISADSAGLHYPARLGWSSLSLSQLTNYLIQTWLVSAIIISASFHYPNQSLMTTTGLSFADLQSACLSIPASIVNCWPVLQHCNIPVWPIFVYLIMQSWLASTRRWIVSIILSPLDRPQV